MSTAAYSKLEKRFRRIGIIRDINEVLHWDNATKMPAGGGPGRSNQLAELSAINHSLLCNTEIGDLLDEAEKDVTLGSWQVANLNSMRRKWRHATALSEELVLALSKASSKCETVWRSARAEDDFPAVLPYMDNLLSLVRECAQTKSEKLGLSQYDALLDEYEPGGLSADIDLRFAELEAFLPEFLGQVLENQKSDPPPAMPDGPFDIAAQQNLGLRLMTALGFDFKHGRLDVSLHPFCGGTPDDVRITTRFDENDFTSAIMGVLHETGHGLYERGLPQEWRYQPVGEALGMAIHESQSLLVEMQMSRSLPFIEFAAPLIRDAFGGAGPAWEPQCLYRNLINVEPGLIRVDADEVTYPMHVILRYRMEKQMILGDLALRDLPAAWNDGLESLLGIRPPNDREGCLQDIHWYDGAWGYFPTYTLGAMTAAQLYAAALQSNPQISLGIAKGNFTALLAWLGKNVHSLGCSIGPEKVIEQATGHPLDSKAFISHLKARYLS
jgi:carboxypeptidase Taq